MRRNDVATVTNAGNINTMAKKINLLLFILLLQTLVSDTQQLWHNKERQVHYLPVGNDFVCVNATRRFNRALYGTNTAFRVEAGDLPEFAMYMPGMGGNLQFALLNGSNKKWLIKVDGIKAIYRPGSMVYEIRDSLLGQGKLFLTILALSNAEGMVVKVAAENIRPMVQLVWIYGGASGKKFSRDGDIGADPESSFYLKAENCTDNRFQIEANKFILTYGTGKALTEEERYEIQTKTENQLAGEIPKNARQITGLFPKGSTVKLIDPTNLQTAFNQSEPVVKLQCLSGMIPLSGNNNFFVLHNTATPLTKTAEQEFIDAEATRQKLTSRIKINTPDKYLNTLASVLSVAEEGVWETPTYMHGAIAWRMRLPGWRGAYAADPLGLHDRARTHFDAYAQSQLTIPATTGVVMDTALNLARHIEKVGTQLFSEGYITRNPNGYIGAHHYDMNLGFIDQLLNHFNYTGDTGYVKKMWPFLKRHLAWEKKNFDADGDGLYDAYAAIWASDALQYSGGGVTHSSAYNYRAFKEMARLAKRIGEDGSSYEKEANKILEAINKHLWMPDKGWYAEYKDLLGNKLLHPAAGLWTIYHALDSKVPDAFQAYQSLRYIDEHIPHIPVKAKGWQQKDLYLLSETNWQPYTWSLNNVVYAENLHTALAYWQGNRSEEAFKLWRSTILESMYLSAGPGNFQQLSFYDAIRGELYRDFADGIGMTARTLVEGLFGIQPDALNKQLIIRPGFPSEWPTASIKTPDIEFSFQRKTGLEIYRINTTQYAKLDIKLLIPAKGESIGDILLNGRKIKWNAVTETVGRPYVEVVLPAAKKHLLVIRWKGRTPRNYYYLHELKSGERFKLNSPDLRILDIYDPQQVLSGILKDSFSLAAHIANTDGPRSFFINTEWGDYNWWVPVDIYVEGYPKYTGSKNNYSRKKFEKINLNIYFNYSLGAIFKNKYLSPRPTSPTLQLPVTGIGNWAYHSLQVNISDSGLRAAAGLTNEFTTSRGIPFQTPGTATAKNIVFTSMWANYPDSVIIPLRDSASYLHLLLAGTTNPMQSRLTNGVIIVNYADGSSDELELKNPENWWPVEQDYYTDSFAFTTDAPKPIRISLKAGREIPENYKYSSIRGFTNFAIDGGAATVLDMPLHRDKRLKNLVFKTIANDVVIGLMSATLEK